MELKSIKDYLDERGLICVKWSDGFKEGGDTMANEGTYWYCAKILNKDFGRSIPDYSLTYHAIRTLDLLHTSKGYVRNPDPSMWYSDDNRISRDQLIPLLCALSIYGILEPLLNLFKAFKENGFFLFAWNTRKNWSFKTFDEHVANDIRQNPEWAKSEVFCWNVKKDYCKYLFQHRDGSSSDVLEWDYRIKIPDLLGPEVWALWIRALRMWWLYPLLILFDLETLVGSISKIWYKGGDDRNHFLIVDHGTRIMPTPTILIAKFIYKNTSPIEKRFKDYWDNPHSPPLHEPMIEVLNTWKNK